MTTELLMFCCIRGLRSRKPIGFRQWVVHKGYERTSLRDIIDGLGGLTKGALYYHFRSKEEILIAVVEDMSRENSASMKEIRDDPSLTGKEQIEKMFAQSLTNPK